VGAKRNANDASREMLHLQVQHGSRCGVSVRSDGAPEDEWRGGAGSRGPRGAWAVANDWLAPGTNGQDVAARPS